MGDHGDYGAVSFRRGEGQGPVPCQYRSEIPGVGKGQGLPVRQQVQGGKEYLF